MAKINKKMMKEVTHSEKSRVPVTNMAYKDSAPPFISIIGPESSGKSTLLCSILAYYRNKKAEPVGPVTIKTGSKRFTYYESTNTIENTIDCTKVSDMIFILVDLEAGLQKNTFETINILNAQGVPKLCFILTHYDTRKSNKEMKEIEKRIQKEFSYPVKIFCFEKEESGTYKNIDKLVRFMEVMKYRPLEWKSAHPHIVVDKTRNEYVYGYLRGGPIGFKFDSYIPGFGSFPIDSIEAVEDPCDPKLKSRILYNPFGREIEEVYESGSDETSEKIDLIESEESVKLFDSDEDREDISSISNNENIISEDENIISNDENTISEDESNESDVSSEKSMDKLKKTLKNRFKNKDLDEEDKFIEHTKEKTTLNFLQIEKQKQYDVKDQMSQFSNLITPGTYVRIKLQLDFDPETILIIGSYSKSENTNTFLKAQMRKNKWQSSDLKNNSPMFFSMGWFRFQSIPVFVKDELIIKYCKNFSEMIFYGPSVPVGTGFFVFNKDSQYRITGTGQVMDSSGQVNTKKKLKLIGHPKTVSGQTVIIQSMFSTQKEADRFLNAKINTSSGLRGLIKKAVGKDGCVRAAFEGTLMMSDTIFMKCLVPLEPYKFIEHMAPGKNFIRPLKAIKTELGLPLYAGEIESDSSVEESESNKKEFEDPRIKKQFRKEREIKKLERETSFSKRVQRVTKETIDLPVPPEQRKFIEEKRLIEEKRRLIDEEADRKMKLKTEEKKKAQIKFEREKEAKKRSLAVESFLDKKKHKKTRK